MKIASYKAHKCLQPQKSIEDVMVKLVKTLMSLRGLTQIEVARSASVSRTALVRYLNEESELKSEALHRILAILGVDIEDLLRREIARSLGADEGYTIGEDLNVILQNAKPIERRTIMDFLIARIKKENTPEDRARITRIKRFAEAIETIGRGN